MLNLKKLFIKINNINKKDLITDGEKLTKKEKNNNERITIIYLNDLFVFLNKKYNTPDIKLTCIPEILNK